MRPTPHNTLTAAAKPTTKQSHAALAKAVMMLPGVGEQKARDLLRRFATVQAIANASESELARCVGTSVGSRIYTFFNSEDKELPT